MFLYLVHQQNDILMFIVLVWTISYKCQGITLTFIGDCPLNGCMINCLLFCCLRRPKLVAV